mmetsp:Transcript_101014/g.324363  ORF Transcript_101014/g.324363 Transcript_101014/m.324363 type:complete len:329 (+) Transcript_101014:574-1560(+)
MRTRGLALGHCLKTLRMRRSVHPFSTPNFSSWPPTDMSTSTASPKELWYSRMSSGTRMCLKKRVSFTTKSCGNLSKRRRKACTSCRSPAAAAEAPASEATARAASKPLPGMSMQRSTSEPSMWEPCKKEPNGFTDVSAPKIACATSLSASMASLAAAWKPWLGASCARIVAILSVGPEGPSVAGCDVSGAAGVATAGAGAPAAAGAAAVSGAAGLATAAARASVAAFAASSATAPATGGRPAAVAAAAVAEPPFANATGAARAVGVESRICRGSNCGCNCHEAGGGTRWGGMIGGPIQRGSSSSSSVASRLQLRLRRLLLVRWCSICR